MAKAILISIKPRYVRDILNGDKTIEIRKSIPKCDLPIDVYIYVTNDKKEKLFRNLGTKKYFLIHCSDATGFNGKVVAKFTLNKVEPIAQYDGKEERYFTKSLWETELFEKSCLSLEEMRNYIHNHFGYAWRIDNLVIFDKPKEIGEFYKKHYPQYAGLAENTIHYERMPLVRAPQSWCYVEV